MINFIKKLRLEHYIIIFLLLCMGKLMWDLRGARKMAKTREVIYQTEVETYKNMAKEEYKSKLFFINEKTTLALYNQKLANENEKLKDKVIYLSNIKTEVRVDTVYTTVDSKEETDSTTRYNWNYVNGDLLVVNGYAIVNHSTREFNNTINRIRMNTQINMNVIEKNKGLYLIIKTDNPYVNITNQDASFYELDKSAVFVDYMKRQNKDFTKKKRFGLGFYAGYGINGYSDNGSYKMNFGPSVGIGLFYNIFQF